MGYDIETMVADYKFGTPESEQQEWIYSDTWATEEMTDGNSRLVITPANRQIKLLSALLTALTAPFWVLYVLVVPGGGGEMGLAPHSVANVGRRVRTLPIRAVCGDCAPNHCDGVKDCEGPAEGQNAEDDVEEEHHERSGHRAIKHAKGTKEEG